MNVRYMEDVFTSKFAVAPVALNNFDGNLFCSLARKESSVTLPPPPP